MKANEQLAAIMKAKGIIQEELANLSDVSQISIHRMLKGTQNLNWKVLKTLRNTYKVNINKFFDE